MIHFNDFVAIGSPDVLKMLIPSTKNIEEQYAEMVESIFRNAILRVCDGVMPSDEELAKRCHIVIDTHGTKHLMWEHPPMAIGDTPDFSKCIASVAAPVFYKPEQEQQ